MALKSSTVSRTMWIRIYKTNYIFLIYLERLINGLAELKQALALKHRTKGQGESTEEMDQQIQRIYTTASCKALPLIYIHL